MTSGELDQHDLSNALDLAGLELEDLEISDFLDEATAGEDGTVSKVMAASCTTCECCCSCVLLATDNLVRPGGALLEDHLDRGQLETLRNRSKPDIRKNAEEAWPELLKQVSFAMATRVEPGSPQATELVKRWATLVHDFTDGDDDMRERLVTLYREDPHRAKQFGPAPDADMIKYMSRCAEAAG